MARVPRSFLPDGLVHVTARGNRRQPIFLVERDALALLDLLDFVVPTFDWTCLAYCLMPNHIHLVLDVERERLSRGMRHLNGVYAMRFNREHGYRGHLLQGRFAAKPIADEGHLEQAIRYVVLNPVRGSICSRPEQWPWSSYRTHLGLAPARRFLEVERVLRLFDADDATARVRMRSFVEEALPAPPDVTRPEAWGQSRGLSPTAPPL